MLLKQALSLPNLKVSIIERPTESTLLIFSFILETRLFNLFNIWTGEWRCGERGVRYMGWNISANRSDASLEISGSKNVWLRAFVLEGFSEENSYQRVFCCGFWAHLRIKRFIFLFSLVSFLLRWKIWSASSDWFFIVIEKRNNWSSSLCTKRKSDFRRFSFFAMTTVATDKPKFQLPEIKENSNGWGPCDLPDAFKGLPFQYFSKGDRIGKIADWSGTLYADKRFQSETLWCFLSGQYLI